jgi:hypothetical protein
MSTRSSKATVASDAAAKQNDGATQYASEADFDDTIAKNRGLPVVSDGAVPATPHGYRATDPEIRRRRLRRMAGELRAEAVLALLEAAQRGPALQTELGKHAPPAARAQALVERLGQTSKLIAAVEPLLEYASELDEIALSDAVIYLEAENKELQHELEHDPALAGRYAALRKFMDARASAISVGMARAKGAAAAAQGNGDAGNGGGAPGK